MRKIFILVLVCLRYGNAYPQSAESRFGFYVDSIFAANPKMVGVTVHVESPGREMSWNYAAGYSDRATKQKNSFDQPVLLASNTKTYVAATILRLVELHKIKLSQSIDKLIGKKSNELLNGRGYKTNEITVRHLLSHTSGIADYASEDYFEFVDTDRQHLWTRDEQIQLAMKTGQPLAAPGDTFKYADVNYLLLTEIIEKYTHKIFYKAIRDLLDFEKNHLDETWFVMLEATPEKVHPLAHQYWEKYQWDSYDLNPSWDLYGGGGLAGTASDLAMFFQLLFDGKIVKDKRVLAMMHADVPSKTKTNYCLGIRKVSIAGLTGYYNGGFWGTDVIYFPALDATVAIFVYERSQRDFSATICAEIVNVLKQTK